MDRRNKHGIPRGDVDATHAWQAPHVRNYPEGGIARGSELKEHMGALPKLRLTELQPEVIPPIEAQTLAAEYALQAVAEGCVGSLALEADNQEPFSPPSDTPWGRESPAELGCELGETWEARRSTK